MLITSQLFRVYVNRIQAEGLHLDLIIVYYALLVWYFHTETPSFKPWLIFNYILFISLIPNFIKTKKNKKKLSPYSWTDGTCRPLPDCWGSQVLTDLSFFLRDLLRDI